MSAVRIPYFVVFIIFMRSNL